MKERVGLYPGTFDPVTNGHLDVIGRAARLVDRLVVGVAMNAGKGPIFPLEERAELVRGQHPLVAVPLEGHPPVGLPPAQRVHADAHRLRDLADPQELRHATDSSGAWGS